MAKIKVHVQTNLVGSKVETEWDLDPADYRKQDGSLDQNAINEIAREMMFDLVEWGYEVDGAES